MAERRSGQRNKKRELRWRRRFERQKMFHRQIREAGGDILGSDNFNSTKGFIQHGNMTVNDHSRNVARYSLVISEKLHISCNRRELIRGALLHDYFLYDWHTNHHNRWYELHGFYHPGVALKNASKEYNLTPREKDIIKKHMWPLTVVPPMCREAWIVTTADKWCSLMETFRLHKGHGALRKLLDEKRWESQELQIQECCKELEIKEGNREEPGSREEPGNRAEPGYMDLDKGKDPV